MILIQRNLSSRALQSSKWQLINKSQWCCSAKCGRPLHVLTNNWTRGKQPANTPLPQSTTPGLHPVSIHQTAPTERTSDCSLLTFRHEFCCCWSAGVKQSTVSVTTTAYCALDIPHLLNYLITYLLATAVFSAVTS